MENVIPDEAVIKLNVRSFDEGVRKRVLAAIERIVKAEAAASGAPRPPEITPLDRYLLAVNDPAATRRVVEAFRGHFSADRVRETGPAARARISGRSARSGAHPLSSGSSAAPTPTATLRLKCRSGSTKSRSITAHALRGYPSNLANGRRDLDRQGALG